MAEKFEEGISSVNVQASFTVKKVPYTACLTSSTLSWKKADGKGAETKIPIEDIVSVKTVTSKSSKKGDAHSLVVCYAQRKAKNILRKTFVTFNGEQSECQQWTDSIQQLLDKLSQRPKKTLVLINPVSGRSKGLKEYQNKVAPHFAEANIQTDVKVTERAGHSLDIIETYDLDSIDSIVMVGGDGMFHEVCNGLLNKVSKQSGVDLNDPNLEVPMIDIPIGIIPCGTGNGVADCNFGCLDVETAALTIIIGKRNNSNVETVHCGGKFVIFSVLLVGAGLWSKLIYKTEKNRQLGVFRYPLIMFQELLIHTCSPINYRVQFKKVQESSDKTAGITDGIATASGNPAEVNQENDLKAAVDDKTTEVAGASKEIINGEEWLTVEKPYTGLITFSINIFGGGATSVDELFNVFTILGTKSSTRMQMLTFFKRMMTKDVMRPLDFVDYMKTTEYTIKVVNPSDPSTEQGIVERLLDIDGEAVQIEHPEFTVRHFPRKLWLFANVPEEYCLTYTGKTDTEITK